MDDKQTYFDQLIRDKFENFEATPPAHVWAGIDEALAGGEQAGWFARFAKPLAAAVVIVLIALALWWIAFSGKEPVQPEITDLHPATEQQLNETSPATASTQETIQEQDVADNVVEDENTPPATTKLAPQTPPRRTTRIARQPVEMPTVERPANHVIVFLESRTLTTLPLESKNRETTGNNTPVFMPGINTGLQQPENGNGETLADFQPYWTLGLFVTPEAILKDFDSVDLLGTWSVNIEPSWYFNKHWFVRFGAGISYVRDRGFAKVDYASNDFIGTYDSVVNVTFDTVGSELIPIYHTKEVDVYDSVRHLVVNEVTNKYYYLNVPLLFGYHGTGRNFKWYLYGGPAVNIAIAEDFEDPKSGIDYIEIIQMENNLPQRVNYSLQLWFGAGIDFRVGQRFSLAVEPNYRYYFNPIYETDRYKTALSGLGLRMGLVYKLK